MITDVVMPGFSGSVLAERLAVIRPETKVLYTSGYADDETVQLNVPGQDYAFLEKPFSRDALIRKVRELLDAHRPRLPDSKTLSRLPGARAVSYTHLDVYKRQEHQ